MIERIRIAETNGWSGWHIEYVSVIPSRYAFALRHFDSGLVFERTHEEVDVHRVVHPYTGKAYYVAERENGTLVRFVLKGQSL